MKTRKERLDYSDVILYDATDDVARNESLTTNLE